MYLRPITSKLSSKTTQICWQMCECILLLIISVNYGNKSTHGKLCDDSNMSAMHGEPDWHGSRTENFTCPMDGVVIGVIFSFEDELIHSLQFICDSAKGITTTEIYGTVTGGTKEERCSENEYIRYFTGEFGGILVNRLRKIHAACKDEGENLIGSGEFDDRCYTTKGRRPVTIKIFIDSDNLVTGFQVEYLPIPVRRGCIVTHIEILDDIKFSENDFEVLGFTSASTCSTTLQQINLDIAESRASSNGSEKSVIRGIGEFAEISIEAGFFSRTIANKFEITPTFKETIGNLNLWTTTNSSSYARQIEYSMGTTITYQGPGMVFLVGLRIVYKIAEKTKVKARLHFTCKDGGSRNPVDELYSLGGTQFGNVFFLDYQATFNSTEDCLKSSYPQECLASIRVRDFIHQPEQLEKEFFNCLNPTVKIPFQ